MRKDANRWAQQCQPYQCSKLHHRSPLESFDLSNNQFDRAHMNILNLSQVSMECNSAEPSWKHPLAPWPDLLPTVLLDPLKRIFKLHQPKGYLPRRSEFQMIFFPFSEYNESNRWEKANARSVRSSNIQQHSGMSQPRNDSFSRT